MRNAVFFGDPHMQLRGFGHAAAYHQLRGLENRRHVIKMRRNLNAAVVKVAL